MKEDCRICFFIAAGLGLTGFCAERPYPIVGTGQTKCYDNRSEISPLKTGQPFYGQDAQHPGLPAHFHDNADGTITDRATGLMWTRTDSGKGLNWEQALAYAGNLKLAGHADWRLPNAKELHSIVDYTRTPAINPMALLDLPCKFPRL